MPLLATLFKQNIISVVSVFPYFLLCTFNSAPQIFNVHKSGNAHGKMTHSGLFIITSSVELGNHVISAPLRVFLNSERRNRVEGISQGRSHHRTFSRQGPPVFLRQHSNTSVVMALMGIALVILLGQLVAANVIELMSSIGSLSYLSDSVAFYSVSKCF